MIGLSRYQKRCFDALEELTTPDGVVPSMEEIGARIGASKSRVWQLLNGLEERGYVRRLRNRSRSIEILVRPGEKPKTPTAAELAALPLADLEQLAVHALATIIRQGGRERFGAVLEPFGVRR